MLFRSRAYASSIQFTDSLAIAPYWTYRSTGDWPVPYGIGWGTGGESSGIFQRFASNGYSLGDMIFYTGNDGQGAFSFRRHTWEGTTHFAAGSGELATELFRVDWSGNLSMLGTLNGTAANSATLYANNGSYGSWKIGGTRNGWYGIEFESAVSLMANSGEVGFYRSGAGWQMRWYNGSGYIYKGNPGGGTEATILDSSNYTSYAAGLGVANTFTATNVQNAPNNTTLNGQSGNLSLTIFQATANTDAFMTFHIGSDFAGYFGLGGSENDLIWGGWSVGNYRYRILHSGNQSYAWNLNQNLRTTDSPTYSELFLSSDGIGAYKFMKYGGTRSGDWQSFTTSSVGAGQMNVVQVENIGGGGHTNYPTGVYTYGGVMSWRLPNHSFQLYAAHTGDLAYKTQWNNDNYSGWRRILDSTNYAYAANMNQNVRTTDNVTFGTVTAALNGNAATATRLVDASNGLRIANPGGASYATNTSTITGAIKIKLPTAAYKSNTMLRFTVRVYEYNGGASGISRTIEVGGYNYSDVAANWYNYFATQTTMGGGDINVRFGNDGASNCIWIGEITQSWSYPQVTVTDFQAGYSNYTDAIWGTGWAISFPTTFDTVTQGPIVAARNLDSQNYTNYTVTKTGTGASGTWGINVTGTAGSISGYNNPTTAATANTIAYRDANGDLTTRYFLGSYVNSSDDVNTGTVTYIMAKFGDNYHRSATAAKVAAFISGQTMNIAGSSTSCTGNAANVTGTVAIANGGTGVTTAQAAMNALAAAVTSGQYLRGNGTNVVMSAIQAADVPTLNQNTTGNAGTATTLATARTLTIGSTGKTFNGSADVSWSLADIGAAATNQTMYIGTTAVAINRASANLALTGITSIDGNAATSTASTRMGLYDGTSFSAGTNSIAASGGRAVNLAPNTYQQQISFEFKNASFSTIAGNYSGLITIAPWVGTTASTGDPSYQLLFSPAAINSTSAPVLQLRAGIDTTWGSFVTMLHSSNYNSYAPTLTGTGASGNWSINVTGTAGSISGYNNPATAANASTIAYRDANADLTTRYFLANRTSAAAGQCGIQLQTAGTSKWWMYLRTNDDNVLAFYTSNATADDIVRMSSTGMGIKIDPSNRLHVNGDGTNPAIRVDNGAVDTATASGGRTFYGWLPMSIGGTTKWIRLFN